MTDALQANYDVIVIGGGAAGLNGALMLARARRSVVVIDAGSPRNAPAAGVHGLLGHEGISPTELLERGRTEVRSYGGHVVTGEVVTTARDTDFTVALADGRSVRARRLLVATGLVDELPDIAGLRERWGRDVVHCPYCHGWEVRDQAIGVLGRGPMTMHQALLFRQLSSDVTLFTHTMAALSDDNAEKLTARGIHVVPGEVAGLEIADDHITGVRLADGTVISRDVVVVPPHMVARAGFLASLGLEPEPHLSGVGEHIPCEPGGRTAVPGVWVAGNVTDLSAQVGAAAAAGAMAGAMIDADLVTEETDAAVAALRSPFSKEFWEQRYGGSRRVWSEMPNPQLVAQISTVTPGTALEAGCGEGADAIWLAGQGWQVTAVDFSTVGLDRAREHAADHGSDVASRINWRAEDLTSWTPEEEQFDLVSAHYMHPSEGRDSIFGRLAAAVAPGGTLLIVGHDPTHHHVPAQHDAHHALFTADQVAAILDPEQWEILVCGVRTRPATVHEGVDTLHDAVLHARKRRQRPAGAK